MDYYEWQKTEDGKKELGDTIQRVLALVGLIGTVIGAGFSGAFDAFKWAIIEEVQRKDAAVRGAMDVVERREEVRL
ncbi:hypothetical protein LJR078_004312 [Arthrobacter sp. LjRoot78]|uniref:hypothetical protein n=1 Tax=Arthrobacter sp. LjRoot78 TaxID=3342338 RepID=UPI003ECEFE51